MPAVRLNQVYAEAQECAIESKQALLTYIWSQPKRMTMESYLCLIAIENGHGVVEWVWSGVDKVWLKPGSRSPFGGVSVIEVHDGKISRNKDFYDGAAILRQLGKLPE